MSCAEESVLHQDYRKKEANKEETIFRLSRHQHTRVCCTRGTHIGGHIHGLAIKPHERGRSLAEKKGKKEKDGNMLAVLRCTNVEFPREKLFV